MTTANIGIRSQNVIVPYVSSTKRTKIMDFSASGLITGDTGYTWTTSFAYVYAYADSNNKWKLNFNIRGALSTPSGDITLIFAGAAAVIFKSGPNQGITASTATTVSTAVTLGNTGKIFAEQASAANFSFSGDVVLESEPTWAAANMEGVLAADVYIANANSTTPGLLPYYSTKNYTGKFKGDNSSNQSGDVTMAVTRIGNVVTLTLPAIIFTSNAADSYLLNDTMAALDAEYRPATELRVMSAQMVAVGSVPAVPGTIVLYDSGLFRIYRDSGGTAFGAGANSGLRNRIGITYHV